MRYIDKKLFAITNKSNSNFSFTRVTDNVKCFSIALEKDLFSQLSYNLAAF